MRDVLGISLGRSFPPHTPAARLAQGFRHLRLRGVREGATLTSSRECRVKVFNVREGTTSIGPDLDLEKVQFVFGPPKKL